jgi:fructosamine-3-kinase
MQANPLSTCSKVPSFYKQYPQQPPEAAHYEAEGLRRIEQTLTAVNEQRLRVPTVLGVGDGWLETQQIAQRSANDDGMRQLGQGLARMHALQHPHYGLDHDNFIGLARQANHYTDHWGEFFVYQRLGKQITAIQTAKFRARAEAILAKHGEPLANWLNRHVEYPSLLHGDLWAGNVLFDGERPWLIDPAVYFGDREADLAMTQLFGGFTAAFYQAYDAMLPRSSHYPSKRVVYNLYHQLNHYNLFGSGYQPACEAGFEFIKAHF